MKDIKKLLKYFKGNNKLIVFAVLFAIIFVSSMLFVPYFTGVVIDSIGNENLNPNSLPNYVYIWISF